MGDWYRGSDIARDTALRIAQAVPAAHGRNTNMASSATIPLASGTNCAALPGSHFLAMQIDASLGKLGGQGVPGL